MEQIVLQLSAEVDPDLPPGAITRVTLSLDGEESGSWLPGEIWLDPAEITLCALELHVVPEPTTALLPALGLVGLSLRQRRATWSNPSPACFWKAPTRRVYTRTMPAGRISSRARTPPSPSCSTAGARQGARPRAAATGSRDRRSRAIRKQYLTK